MGKLVWVCMECRTEQPNNELQCVKCGNILPELFEEKDAYNETKPAPKPKTMVKEAKHVTKGFVPGAEVEKTTMPAPTTEVKEDEVLIPQGDRTDIDKPPLLPGKKVEEKPVEDKPKDKPKGRRKSKKK